ncbi:MAG: hypothetical protein ACI8RE_003112 [Ilumatobacter sp.]|jgi:hypothetical protein
MFHRAVLSKPGPPFGRTLLPAASSAPTAGPVEDRSDCGVTLTVTGGSKGDGAAGPHNVTVAGRPLGRGDVQSISLIANCDIGFAK